MLEDTKYFQIEKDVECIFKKNMCLPLKINDFLKNIPLLTSLIAMKKFSTKLIIFSTCNKKSQKNWSKIDIR